MHTSKKAPSVGQKRSFFSFTPRQLVKRIHQLSKDNKGAKRSEPIEPDAGCQGGEKRQP